MTARHARMNVHGKFAAVGNITAHLAGYRKTAFGTMACKREIIRKTRIHHQGPYKHQKTISLSSENVQRISSITNTPPHSGHMYVSFSVSCSHSQENTALQSGQYSCSLLFMFFLPSFCHSLYSLVGVLYPRVYMCRGVRYTKILVAE